MELNSKVDKKLTTEQKIKFQRENGKFKLLDNIVLIPILSSLLGIYLESIILVSISIVCIIIFLICRIHSFSRKNVVYEENIIPIILKEKFNNILYVDKKDVFSDEFRKANLIKEYSKIKVDKSFIINNDKYEINVANINVQKMNVEENDGVIDKELEEVLSGVFAYVKLPVKSLTNFRVISKGNENNSENLVKIPYLEFDENYDVFSLNPVEARNILSSGVMARILEFNSKIGKKINFSIYEEMLYVSIDYNKFLDFKGNGKKYIDEEIATENLDVLEILDVFIRYIVNIFEK